MFTATVEAKRIIQEFGPDVCVGTGGYVCGPVLREAAKLGIPCVIHESNRLPRRHHQDAGEVRQGGDAGRARRKQYFDSSVNCVVTGNPVRGEVLTAQREESRKALGLDERAGGAPPLGAVWGPRPLNRAAAYMLAQSAKTGEYQHIHGYGSPR